MLRDRDDAPDEIGAAPVSLDYELPVDLHIVELKATKQIQIAVLGAKIVDRKLDSLGLECVEDRCGACAFAQQKPLGQFEDESDARRQFGDQGFDLGDEAFALQVARRDIDAMRRGTAGGRWPISATAVSSRIA